MKPLSHLSYVTLGIISRRAPITGYQVMKEFQDSSSSYFSGSAGAIYPMLRRLQKEGLIEPTDDPLDGKTKARYRLTAFGQERLMDWVKAPIPDDDVAYSIDFLRSRMFFMGELTREEVEAFIADARAKLQAQIASNKAKVKAHAAMENTYSEIAIENLVMADQARLKWLDLVEKRLLKSG